MARRLVRIQKGLCAVVVTALAVGGAGCGSSSNDGGGGGDVPSEFTIGASLPLTGPGAAYGAVMRNGLQLAVDRINADGGLKGSKFKLSVLDSQAQAGPAVANAKQLIRTDKAVAIVTAFTTPPLAQLPMAEQSKTPLFNGGGYDPQLLGHDLLYNNILSLGQEARAGMRYAKDELGVSKLGVLVETNLTAEGVEEIEGLWKEIAGTDAVVAQIDQTATNAGPQLDQLLAANPDALYLATDGNISSLVYKQLSQRNVDIPIVSSSASLAVPEATKSPGLDLYFSRQAFEPTADFEKAYGAKFDEEPNIYFVNYYNVPYIIRAGLEYAIEHDLGADGAGLQEALGKLGPVEGCCGKTSFTERHGTTDPAQIVTVEAGKIKVLESVETS